MSGAYLPLPRWLRDKVNGYLAGMAARGFVPPPMDEVVRTASAEQLPEGVFEQRGQLVFVCRSCDQTVPLECDLDEFDPDVAYCGGSPRCLP
jgi:hypothetical protein